MMCFVTVTVLFSRKESLENKKSEKPEGDQKKPKDSKVFILKIVSFLRSSFTHFDRQCFSRLLNPSFLQSVPGHGNLILMLCILKESPNPKKSFWFQDILARETLKA